MSDDINWQSAFSDDSLDGALDKAKQAKQKFDDVSDKVAQHRSDDAEADTQEIPNPVADDTAEIAAPAPPPPPAKSSIVVTPLASERAPQTPPPPEPPVPPQSTPPANPVTQPAPPAAPPTPAPQPVHSAPAQPPSQGRTSGDDDKRGGFPFRRIVGALVAIVPLVIAAVVFLGGGGDPIDRVCEEARQRLEASAAGGFIDESRLPERCQDGADSDSSPGAIDDVASDSGNEDSGGEDEESEEIEQGEPPGQNVTFPSLTEGEVADDGAAASGCSPGDGALPDGVWFGYAAALNADAVDFDLVCAYSGTIGEGRAIDNGEELGDALFYVINDTPAMRALPVAPGATGWPLINDENPSSTMYSTFISTPSSSPLALPIPVWVYVNGGQLTEIATIDPSSILEAGSAQVQPPIATNCDSSQIPQDATVQVVNIPADDPDGGLNFRQLPDPSSPILGTHDNGTQFTPTGGCELRTDGAVWWEVTGQGITGWANSSFLEGV